MQSIRVLAATVVAMSALSTNAYAQESVADPAEPDMARADSTVEETVVLGRFLSAAHSLLQDRIEDDALVDSLDSE
ncbi:MAG: hypothetical protein L7S71_03210, partial [Pseudomonadales bacterium]|nr:hypothetical protein [Pseudomonadales bacterium]